MIKIGDYVTFFDNTNIMKVMDVKLNIEKNLSYSKDIDEVNISDLYDVYVMDDNNYSEVFPLNMLRKV